MKNFFILLLGIILGVQLYAQTNLTEALDFSVKDLDGNVIELFPLLDDENKIVVIDFFSTSCGPCQTYAPHFQQAYEAFGFNEGNVYFLGINWGSDNELVAEFDEEYGITLPTASGTQGGGNAVFELYEILSYPTVIVITPDHQIVEQYIDPPSFENITDAVTAAGGILVNTQENKVVIDQISVYPNPVGTAGYVAFNIRKDAGFLFSIYDLTGQELFRSQAMYLFKGQQKIKLPVENLTNGMYFVQLIIDEKIPETIRFVVAK